MLKTYKIQDICVLEKGKQIDTSLLDDNNPYQYINGGISASGYYDKYNTKENTIIVSEGGASCGYVNFMTEKFWCGCHCYRLMEPKVKSEYLYYALKANQHGIMRLRSGCAMPNIKKSSFYNMQIKLDDNQDNQIKVTSILKKVTTLILKRKEQLTKIDFLAKSRFIEMFGDVESNPNNLEISTLGRECLIVSGATPPTGKPEYWNGDIKWITPAEIGESEYIISNTIRHITQKGKDIAHLELMPKGTILLSSRAPIGKLAITNVEMTCNQGFKNLIPKSRLTSIFLYYYLKGIIPQIQSMGRGATFKEISKPIVSSIKILVPHKREQVIFGSFIQRLDKSKFRIKKSLEKLEMTYKALLQEYFG